MISLQSLRGTGYRMIHEPMFKHSDTLSVDVMELLH